MKRLPEVQLSADQVHGLIQHLSGVELEGIIAGEVDAVFDPSTAAPLLLRGAQEALRRREQEFRALVENAPDIIARFDRDLRHVYVNRAVERATGLPAKAFIGRTNEELNVPADQVRLWNHALREVFKTRQETELEFSYHSPDGDRHFQARLVPEFAADGSVETVLGISRDDTARWEAEQETRAKEEWFRSLIENAVDGVAVIGADGTLLYQSPSVERVMGFTQEEMMGRSALELVHPEDVEHCAAAIAEVLASPGTSRSVEYRYRNKEGEWRVMEGTAQCHSLGTPGGGVVINARDITERKESEKSLRASQEQLALALQGAEQGLWDWNVATGSCYFSPECERLLGHLPGESEPHIQTWEEGLHPEDQPRVMALLDSVLTGETELYVAEYRIRTREGGWKWVSARGKVVEREANGTALRMTGVFGDISQKKEAEESMRQSEALFRELIENSLDIIGVITPEGDIRYANTSTERVLGYEAGTIVGKKVLDYIHPDDLRSLEEGFYYRAQTPGTGIVMEFRVRHVNGSWRTLEASAHNLLDQPSIRGFLVTARDITEGKEMEEQFRQSQKMEAVGRLAGGIAHDFNNLLTAIAGNSDLLLMDTPAGDPARADLEEIRKAADRATALTRQLLAFSRRQVLEPVVLDLNSVVENSEKMLRRLVGEDVELVTILDASLGQVKADCGQIEQVLMNLVVNARDAMPTGGKLVIETSNAELDAAFAAEYAYVTPGPYVVFSVSDTGVGMTDEVRKQIFEPFFTTKQVGEGTGLGLSTVYGIVKQSGGYIWAYSEVGIGTTLKVYLPRVEGETAGSRPAAADSSAAELAQGTQTILLVEDEAVVRAIARRALQKAGYTVLQAGSGAEALQICDQFEGAIDLLLTDIVMPGMNGRELVAEVARKRPGTRSLYMSGYTAEMIARHGVLEDGLAFLQKPFTPRSLTEKVRSILLSN